MAGAALRPFCPLGSANKATFRDQFCGGWSIQRMRLSWRWGRERKPKMVRTGPRSGGAAKSPKPACREDGAAGPIVSWALPPGPLPLLYNQCQCVCGVLVSVWWSVVGVLCAGACQGYLHNGTSLRIYFSFQFPNFDRQAWSPGLSLSLQEQGFAWGRGRQQARPGLTEAALIGGVLGTGWLGLGGAGNPDVGTTLSSWLSPRLLSLEDLGLSEIRSGHCSYIRPWAHCPLPNPLS